MENTSCGKNCAFVKTGFCETEKECPHFLQTIWQQEGNPVPKIVDDCFPKKFALEQNQLLHRFLSSQSVLEELRFKVQNLEDTIKQLCNILSGLNTKNNDKNLILDDKEILKSIE